MANRIGQQYPPLISDNSGSSDKGNKADQVGRKKLKCKDTPAETLPSRCVGKLHICCITTTLALITLYIVGQVLCQNKSLSSSLCEKM